MASKIASAALLPLAARAASWLAYAAPLEKAPAKIVGFVVTPETARDSIRAFREPDSMRSRDKSSSQMLTPAFARS